MKKSLIRLLTLTLVIIMVATIVSACSSISGKYESAEVLTVKTTYEFSGKNYTKTVSSAISSTPSTGTYSVKDGYIYFDDSETGLSFEKGSDYIKIAGVTYTKVK